MSLGTKSAYKPDPTTSCAKILVIRTSRSRYGTAGRLHGGSSSPTPQSGTSELKLTRQALIRNTKTARQAEKAGAELLDGVESSADDLVLTDSRQPFGPQLITGSIATQIRPNDPVVIQGRQTDYIDEILRVHTQTVRSLAVADPMVDRILKSTASLLQTSTSKECYFSKKDCEPGRRLQLQHTTSIYANCSLPCATCVPAPSYPSWPVTSHHEDMIGILPHMDGFSQAPESCIRLSSRFNVKEESAGGNTYPLAAQIGGADYNSTCPSLTRGSEKSKANCSAPSAFPEQEVSHLEPQDAPLLHGESSDFTLIGTSFNTTPYPTENAGAFSHPGPFQATGNDPLQLPINDPEMEESFGMVQATMPAPQAGPHSLPLQAASDSTNKVGRTCPTLWDGSEFFNFDFEEANTDPQLSHPGM